MIIVNFGYIHTHCVVVNTKLVIIIDKNGASSAILNVLQTATVCINLDIILDIKYPGRHHSVFG